jgi:hypothetical protein
VLDLFNAAASNNDSVRYASVINCAPRWPILNGIKDIKSIYSPVTMGLFSLSYLMNRRVPKEYPYPEPEQHLMVRIEKAVGFTPTAGSNDGVVPLFSQIWGDVIHVCLADHLDVVGQFTGAGGDPTYAGWFQSGSGFGEREFRNLWGSVADFIGQTV